MVGDQGPQSLGAEVKVICCVQTISPDGLPFRVLSCAPEWGVEIRVKYLSKGYKSFVTNL